MTCTRDMTSFSDDALELGFADAGSASGVIERSYKIGRLPLTVRCAGDELGHIISSAFGPPSSAGRDPFIVHVWDAASTATTAPPLPRVEAGATTSPRYFTQTGDRTVMGQPLEGVVNVIDGGRAFWWLRDAGEVPWYEKAAPFRYILSWWLASRDCHLVHAAAVGAEDGGVLIVGPGGAGKSTAAVVCAVAGHAFAGDDYVAITAGAEPVAHPVFHTAKIGRDIAHRLGGIEDAVALESPPDEKVVVSVDGLPSPTQVSAIPIRAVVRAIISGDRATTVSPGSSAAALAAIGASTVLQLPGTGPAPLTALASIVRRVPVFDVRFGTDLDDIPAAISRILDA